MRLAGMMALGVLLWSGVLQAQSSVSTQSTPAGAVGGNIDVVVPMPNTGDGNRANRVNCSRCCLYQDSYYSEGAVVSSDGFLLQCQADSQVLSTNNLRWVILKQK